MKHKTTVGILSLGCPRNLTDSENIVGRLSAKGYSVVDIACADIAIVNTCAFIKDAKVESVDALMDLIDLKKQGRIKKIIVYGCLAQRYKGSLAKELPEIDAFVGSVSLNHEVRRFPLTPSHYAYLKICEGCVQSCSYCIIPKIKGRFLSLDVATLLDKVAAYDRAGVKELNIIGQDISAYGMDLYGRPSLAHLLKKICSRLKDISWVRLLYLHPKRLDDELLALIKHEPRVCKYIDLPLQHVNRRILSLMNRATSEKGIRVLIDKIRKTVPQAALRTSLIVGFPSETEEEFRELLDFIEEVRFERLGVFMYSREEGTSAYALKPQVPDALKRERFDILMQAQQRISQDVNSRFLGKTLPVMIDEGENGQYLGRSHYDAPEVDGQVYVASKKPLKPGEIVEVRITDTLEYDLVAEALHKDSL